jgi:hypothetical protein
MRTTRTITAGLAALICATALAGPASAEPASPQRASHASVSGLFDTAVKFRNRYDTTIWVAFMRYDPDGCAGDGSWQTKGWLKLYPGQVKQGFSTSNRYAYYYAKAADGTKWSGANQSVRSKPVYVYQSAFDSCLGIGSTGASDVVTMRKIEVRKSGASLGGTYTVNLT